MKVYLLWKIYESIDVEDEVIGVFELRDGAISFKQDYPEPEDADWFVADTWYYYIDERTVS